MDNYRISPISYQTDGIMNVTVIEEIMTSEQVADVLGCSRKVVESKLRNGELVGSKRVGKWFVLRSDLVSWIEQGKARSNGNNAVK
jgi:hypothetical protein